VGRARSKCTLRLSTAPDGFFTDGHFAAEHPGHG
jgi:hypothetical protein